MHDSKVVKTYDNTYGCQLSGYTWAIILCYHCCSQRAITATSYIPAFILLEVRLPCTVEKLFETDESIVILVNLLHDMFPHSVHLLVSLHHVILWCIGIVCFVELSVRHNINSKFTTASCTFSILWYMTQTSPATFTFPLQVLNFHICTVTEVIPVARHV